MRRTILCVWAVALCAMALSCAGEDGSPGLPGSPGNPGSPLPIQVLLAGSEPADSLQRLALDIFATGLLPLGNSINVVDITDSIPPLSLLNGYDAILVWTTSVVTDPVALGNRLADFVDDGGGVVIGQMSFVNGIGLQGRIMTSGYSPLASEDSVGVMSNRKIAFTSIASPIHPILNGTNLLDFLFFSTSTWSNPTLTLGATQIAADNTGASAIAVNAGDNIVGINMSGNFFRGGYEHPPALFVNSLLFVAGAF